MSLSNPFKPGAGHPPPYLAGRDIEQREFKKLLKQETILQNLILTGLRGVGKTVLTDSLKPIAIEAGWAWIGTELSESASLSEQQLAERMLVDLSSYASGLSVKVADQETIGFKKNHPSADMFLNHAALKAVFDGIPGLVKDKLQGTLEFVWRVAPKDRLRGIIFAYDEAQTISDHADKTQYPVAMLLDTFQSIQRKGVKIMLLLSGLPTLFPRLVESRTFAERMFRILELKKLMDDDARKAITVPLSALPSDYPGFTKESIDLIVQKSSGYPYFIQFICREVFDLFLALSREGRPLTVPIDTIILRLDTDFFAGRWARATDRQRDILRIISELPSCNDEFTVQEISEKSKTISTQLKPFSPSHVTQILNSLSDRGLIYKNRHGKYVFAVPLFGDFIRRQTHSGAA